MNHVTLVDNDSDCETEFSTDDEGTLYLRTDDGDDVAAVDFSRYHATRLRDWLNEQYPAEVVGLATWISRLFR